MRQSHDTIHQDFLIITGVIFAIFVGIVAILSSSILFFCLRFHSGGDITWQLVFDKSMTMYCGGV